MLLNVAIAAFMMIVTTCIHAGGMELMLRGIKKHRTGLKTWLRKTRIYWVVTTILVMFVVALLEALAWACVYLAFGALKGLEQALYFSLVTFTTLGYGEIVLDELVVRQCVDLVDFKTDSLRKNPGVNSLLRVDKQVAVRARR